MMRCEARIRRDSASRNWSVSAWSFVQAVGAAIAGFPLKSCLSTAVRLSLQVTIIKCLRVFSHWQNKVAIDSGKPEKVMYDMHSRRCRAPSLSLLAELAHGPSFAAYSAQQLVQANEAEDQMV